MEPKWNIDVPYLFVFSSIFSLGMIPLGVYSSIVFSSTKLEHQMSSITDSLSALSGVLVLPFAREGARKGSRKGAREQVREGAMEVARERTGEGAREGARKGSRKGAREQAREGAREQGREQRNRDEVLTASNPCIKTQYKQVQEPARIPDKRPLGWLHGSTCTARERAKEGAGRAAREVARKVARKRARERAFLFERDVKQVHNHND